MHLCNAALLMWSFLRLTKATYKLSTSVCAQWPLYSVVKTEEDQTQNMKKNLIPIKEPKFFDKQECRVVDANKVL